MRTRKIIDVQEAAHRLDAPVPRHIRTRLGGWISGGYTLEEWVPGERVDVRDKEAARRFGTSLAALDGALARFAPLGFFVVGSDSFQNGKNPKWVAERLLPACRLDRRFPPDYARLVEEHCAFFERVAYRPDLNPVGLVNVDPNIENALFDADRDSVVFVDLDLEARTLGYSLGPALFWWLYPTAVESIDCRIVRTIMSAYRTTTGFPPVLVNQAILHLLDFSLMELSLPVAFSLYGAPKGVEPFDRIEERLARARLIFDQRERLEEEAGV